VTWALAILGFMLLVVLHELGHFAVAKWTGMRVEKFSLFFGPMIAKTTRGETTYGLGVIPLGGYVKISGMSPHEDLPPEVVSRAYLNQPVWKRIVVILAGPAVNIVLAFLVLWILFWSSTDLIEPTRNVDKIDAGSPAAAVLQPGDELVAVDGVRGERQELTDQIASHGCAGKETDGCKAAEPVRLTVSRDGAERSFTVTPVYDGEIGKMRIGFSYATRPLDFGAGGAATHTVDTLWGFTTQTVSTIAQLFKAEKRKQISGVVGVTDATRKAIDIDLESSLFLLAVVSFSLGIINLFPFLPLDGGHIFWALAEKIRGRAIPFHVLERAGVVGFALVIMLFFIGLSNDVGRLTGDEQFQVR
jgi:regulator of sigma E protease